MYKNTVPALLLFIKSYIFYRKTLQIVHLTLHTTYRGFYSGESKPQFSCFGSFWTIPRSTPVNPSVVKSWVRLRLVYYNDKDIFVSKAQSHCGRSSCSRLTKRSRRIGQSRRTFILIENQLSSLDPPFFPFLFLPSSSPSFPPQSSKCRVWGKVS